VNTAAFLVGWLLTRVVLVNDKPLQAPITTDEASGGLDEREYNAGRVIGILERWLIYSVLVVSNEYAVIALIIAAKGFTRFRQLDQREFAEYVLVGTLASTLFTIWVALGIRFLVAT